MNIIVAVAQSAAPRTDTGSVTATVSLVRQVGSTTATAIVGGLIGAGRHSGPARIAGCRDPHPAGGLRILGRCAGVRSPSSTRACWRRSSSASRSPTRSASSRRSCCRRAGSPTSSSSTIRPCRGRDRRRMSTSKRDAMSTNHVTHPTIAIVGSGPIGSAYARVLVEQLPDARVVMFEAGPAADRDPGRERAQHRRPRREGARPRDVAGPAGR